MVYIIILLINNNDFILRGDTVGQAQSSLWASVTKHVYKEYDINNRQLEIQQQSLTKASVNIFPLVAGNSPLDMNWMCWWDMIQWIMLT